MATANLSALENGTITRNIAAYLNTHLSPPMDFSTHRICVTVPWYCDESGTCYNQECHSELGWSNDQNAVLPEITGVFPANVPGVEDLAGIPVKNLYRWEWRPSEQETTPGYWNFTPYGDPRLNYVSYTPFGGFFSRDGLFNWDQWRPAIEYVGTALAAAYVGGELLAPVAEGGAVAADAAVEGAGLGLPEAITPVATEIAPVVESTLPEIIAPEVGAPIAETLPEVIAPATEIAPVAETTTTLAGTAGEVKTAVGVAGTVKRIIDPPKPPIHSVPSVQPMNDQPAPDESGVIPVLGIIGLMLFNKV